MLVPARRVHVDRLGSCELGVGRSGLINTAFLSTTCS